MENKIKDTRSVKLEKVLSGDFIPLFGGRPDRSAKIGKDDSLDLKIFLNVTTSVEEFLQRISRKAPEKISGTADV